MSYAPLVKQLHVVSPTSLARLRDEAGREGVNNVERLLVDWEVGTNRFDGPGEALFGARIDDDLVGIGGVNREPSLADAMRMRRLYVAPFVRRQGVGDALARMMIRQGFAAGASVLTCNARASAAASPFWEAVGFEREDAATWTHVLRRPA